MKEAMKTRRSLMTGLGAAAAGAMLVPAVGGAQTTANNFRPARRMRDSWMGELKGQHRMFIDSATAKGGTQFAICDIATNFFAAQIAQDIGANKDTVYKELVASAIPNSHFVPAGVVAVTRSQEYDYSLLVAG